MTASIVVNGRREPLAQRTLDVLLTDLGHDVERGAIAVAVNGRVVPRSAWAVRALEDGDEIDVLGAVQGG